MKIPRDLIQGIRSFVQLARIILTDKINDERVGLMWSQTHGTTLVLMSDIFDGELISTQKEHETAPIMFARHDHQCAAAIYASQG